MIVLGVQQSDSFSLLISSFSNSLPIQVVTQYQEEFSALRR